ncbi:MAG: hypothetical protein ACK6DA_11870 [Candidatus Kapaibacterium sp.]
MIKITKKGDSNITHIKMVDMLNYPNEVFQEYSKGKPQEWYFINPGINEKNLIVIWYDDEDNEYKLSTEDKKGLKEYNSFVTAVKVTDNIDISINIEKK